MKTYKAVQLVHIKFKARHPLLKLTNEGCAYVYHNCHFGRKSPSTIVRTLASDSRFHTKTNYYVKRSAPGAYVVHTATGNQVPVSKKGKLWYACTRYHTTLRDAIVYIVYGV